MASQQADKLTSLADEPKITAELKAIVGGLREVRQEIDDISKIEGIAKAVKSLSELKKVTDDLNTANERAAAVNEKLRVAQEQIGRLSAENAKLKTNEAKATTELANATINANDESRELLSISVQNEIALKKLSSAKKDLESAFKSGAITEQDYLTGLVDIKEAQTQLVASQSDVSRGLKAITKDANAMEGSIEQASARIALLKQARDKLNTTDPKQKKQIDEINKLIDEQNDIIKENVSALEKQKINVGNYGGSAKIIVDALERMKIRLNETTKAFGEQSPEAQRLRGELEGLQRITDAPQFLKISAKVGDTTAELKYFSKQLNILEDAGLKNSEVYKQVIERLAQLQDQLGDTRAEVKALSSDTRGFDLFAGAVTSITDSFQVATGVAGLFGANTEELQKKIAVLSAVENIANGVRSIANQLTQKGTFLNKAFTLAVGSSTGAMKAFRLAIAATGLGLLLITLSQVVEKLNIFGSSANDANKSLEKLNETIEYNARIRGFELGDVDKKIKLTKAQLEQNLALAKSEKEKVAIQKQINDLEVEGIDAKIDSNRQEIAQNSELIRANNETIRSRKESAKNNVELTKKTQELIDRNNDLIETNEILRNDKSVLTTEQKTKAIEKQIDATKKLAEVNKDKNDKELQVQFNIRALELQQEADFAKEIADDDTKSKQVRLDALNVFTDKSSQIIRGRAELEKLLGKKTASEIILIERQKYDELLRLDRDAIKQRTELNAINEDAIHELSAEELAILDAVENKTKQAFQNTIDRLAKEAEVRKQLQDQKKAYAEEERAFTKQLYDEFVTTVASAFTAADDRRKENIQKQIDAGDVAAQKEIERINKEVQNKSDAEAQIQIIESRTAANRIVLENKQREIDKKKSQVERLAQAATIVGNTAQGVTSLTIKAAEARAQAALLLSNPLTAIYAPVATAQAALITAQIPFVIGIGAAQLARLIIPKYAMGVDDHPGGLMIVGDGGKSEGVKLPDGTVLKSPATSTVMYAPPGTSVDPDYDKMILRATLTNLPDFQHTTRSDNTGALMAGFKSLEKTIKNKTENHWEVPGRWDTYMANGHSFRKYLDNNL